MKNRQSSLLKKVFILSAMISLPWITFAASADYCQTLCPPIGKIFSIKIQGGTISWNGQTYNVLGYAYPFSPKTITLPAPLTCNNQPSTLICDYKGGFTTPTAEGQTLLLHHKVVVIK